MLSYVTSNYTEWAIGMEGFVISLIERDNIQTSLRRVDEKPPQLVGCVLLSFP